MKYFIISDTHLGHEAMVTLCGRKPDFSEKLLGQLQDVPLGSVFIHMGDILIGNDAYWHDRIMERLQGARKWLVRGNHDRKSDSWYLDHGWDMVCEKLEIQKHGWNIVFSHKPLEYELNVYTINIHGHLHNMEHRAKTGDGFLFSCEEWMRPVELQKFMEAKGII
jgi:calcineurin-like phosphoesterase family protein